MTAPSGLLAPLESPADSAAESRAGLQGGALVAGGLEADVHGEGRKRPSDAWNCEKSAALYQIHGWGKPYFSVNGDGHVEVRPDPRRDTRVDLHELVEDLQAQGVDLPLLLRFPNILEDRIRLINQCFHRAIKEYGYKGTYRGVYPVKVNQQRHLVEDLVAFGKAWGFGLEAGSKPELLIAVASMIDQPQGLILCNGYKDKQYIETALLAQQLGHTVVIVLERFEELEMVLASSEALGIEPCLGVRAKLNSKGVGRWAKSSGERAKFGLRPAQIMRVVETLQARGKQHQLQLLHFHIGSQVSSISPLKTAIREAANLYTELSRLGCGMRYFDVGGGLAVDYDGSKTDFHASKNYDTQEYAYDVVAAIQAACARAKVGDPVIVSESGRAVAAYQSVLVFEVVGVDGVETETPEKPCENAHTILQDLYETWAGIRPSNLQEAWHDAIEAKGEAQSLFNFGYLDLAGLAQAEKLFWGCCRRIAAHLQHMEFVPEELQKIPEVLGSIYFCNFSVFQSAPDVWAIDQLFPIMPIHRLAEKPSVHATLADLTCDSDGMIDQFIDKDDVKHVLDVHPVRPGEPYMLAMFLNGAYQEILGDLHNLFGDTNAVHITLDPVREAGVDDAVGADKERTQSGDYHIAHLIKGDSVFDVLRYVQYEPKVMIEMLRKQAERAMRVGSMTRPQLRTLMEHFEASLRSYTYLREVTPMRASDPPLPMV